MDDRTLVNAATEADGEPAAHHKNEIPTTPLEGPTVGSQMPTRTLWGDAWRRLRRNKLAVGALVYLAIIITLSATADLWAKAVFGEFMFIDSTTAAEMQFEKPSLAHPMGRDDLGRDELARVLYGARVSLAIGVLATLLAIVIGLLMGGISAFYGGLIDGVVMRLTDVFLAFPYILFAILLMSVLGPGFMSLVIAIGILGWTTIARVFRSSVLSIKENEYVDAARAMGASDLRIMLRHILPNAMAPIIVYATMSVGGVILSEAALSFLGLGVQPPTPSWGRMLDESQSYMVSHPSLFIWPGIAILSTVLAFVLLGDGLRDALDVKMKD